MTSTDEQTGNEAIEEIAKEPTLDFYFDNNPRTLTDEQLRALVERERRERALFIAKKEK